MCSGLIFLIIRGSLKSFGLFADGCLWNSGILSAIDVVGDHALVGVSITKLKNMILGYVISTGLS